MSALTALAKIGIWKNYQSHAVFLVFSFQIVYAKYKSINLRTLRKGASMARVTVEDCIDKVDNRFELVLLAAHRARQISQGAEITIDRDNDKNPVVALREIADETLSPADLKEDLIHSLQKHVEVDEPEPEPALIGHSDEAEDVFGSETKKPDEKVSFDHMSEDELLAGIEGLVAPEKNDDY